MALRKRTPNKPTSGNITPKKKTTSKLTTKKKARHLLTTKKISALPPKPNVTKRTNPGGLRVVSREGSVVTVEPTNTAGRRLLSRTQAAETAPTTSRAIDILGGEKILGTKLRSQADVIEAIREGFPDAALDSLLTHLNLSKAQLAKITGIPLRTLMRKLGQEQRLNPSQSDRIYRVALISALAEQILGSVNASSEWLSTPHLALGQVIPLDLLDTEAGTEEVRNLLYRINMSGYS
ncbi:MAG: antitoxin Xre-like helix-turn-helix domain-containing protein [Pseudomonadota bacterium]